MTAISTERLNLVALSAEDWRIECHQGNTLGQIAYSNHRFSIHLLTTAQGLGVATEAATAWLKVLGNENTTAAQPIDALAQAFLNHLGFVDDIDHLVWRGQLPKPQYRQLNTQLGINTKNIKAPYCPSACQLIDIGLDVFDRPSRLTPEAAASWQLMQQAAQSDGITLQLVSAFRSPKYQAGLIKRKIDKGLAINDILKVNTAPGHSEHHTGRAIDLTSPGSEILEESFDQSDAFLWLKEHANKFQFFMTYPKNSPHGIVYEPWHWCFQPSKPSSLNC